MNSNVKTANEIRESFKQFFQSKGHQIVPSAPMVTKDPTPIEVAMRNYEEDVDKALIATAGREGKEEES